MMFYYFSVNQIGVQSQQVSSKDKGLKTGTVLYLFRVLSYYNYIAFIAVLPCVSGPVLIYMSWLEKLSVSLVLDQF